MRNEHRLVLFFFALVSFLALSGCSDPDRSTVDGSVDAAMIMNDSGASPDGGPPPIARWMLESNLSVNGTRIQDAIRSAVATEIELPNGPGYRVVLVTVPEYCALLRDEGCVPDGEEMVAITINGRSAGSYSFATAPDAGAGTFSLFWMSVDAGRCTGGVGFGPTDGTLRITEASANAVSIEFDVELSLVGASANLSGSVDAPVCPL